MTKILFLIHDLGHGGAEKVLVNLVNNMDRTKFDITVATLFGGGVNEQFLAPHIKHYSVLPRAFPGNSRLMKLFSPRALHRLCVRGQYDIEVSYLEGPSARIISGSTCPDTRLISWIHIEQHTMKVAASSFRSAKEAERCYARFDETVCVSESVKEDFTSLFKTVKSCRVLYNTVESDKIRCAADEEIDITLERDKLCVAAVGKLTPNKGCMRLLETVRRMKRDGVGIHLYFLGTGPLEGDMRRFIEKHDLEDSVTLLGYSTNPYKYVARCDLFVCASFKEGFSTAAVEALIVGTPVCTVEVSGMREMLADGEYGMIVDNDEDSLERALRTLATDRALLEHYRERAAVRGASFSTENTVRAVEEMLSESGERRETYE